MLFSFQRPIAGYVNFCPISIADNEGDLMAVATHEVLHALVSRLWLECLTNVYMFPLHRMGQKDPHIALCKPLNPSWGPTNYQGILWVN